MVGHKSDNYQQTAFFKKSTQITNFKTIAINKNCEEILQLSLFFIKALSLDFSEQPWHSDFTAEL